MASKTDMGKDRHRGGGLGIIGGVLGGGDDSEAAPAAPTTDRSPSPVSQMTALEQMELAFVGVYSQAQIKEKLEHAMVLYGLSDTEEKRSRAGSALVALRQEFGPSEMEILDHMIRSHVPGVDLSFPDAAGLSAAPLGQGDG